MWRSQGYGYVYEIRGAALKAFEVTTQTCVSGFTAKRLAIAVPGREATFKTRRGDVFFISTGTADDHKLLNHPDGLAGLKIDRIPRMPAVCNPPTANTPLDNFEVFARTWAEHYIAFDLKHADWDKIVADNRQKVTLQTMPARLLEIFEAMIKPLGDLHTGIEAPRLKHESESFFRPGTDRVIKKSGIGRFETKGRRALFGVTDRAYLHGPLRKFCNGQIQYGHIGNSTGYLRILAFGGYSKHGGFTKGLVALESALDAIFSDPALQALVIDVRLSFGGDDRYGLAIASRLAAREYLAYTKQARADQLSAANGHPAIRSWSGGVPAGFWGPAVELIGPITMSAAEAFNQALMGRTPQARHVGENTQRVIPDVLDRRLPNGWTFGLQNELCRTLEGTAFDVQGIPPDIAVPVFDDEDVVAGKDPGMAKTVQILQKKNRGCLRAG